MAFERAMLTVLKSRLAEPRRFIQVLAGPRQVGKTTLVLQLRDGWNGLPYEAFMQAELEDLV